MPSDANAGNHWERVAAELRACREAQQRAWGDLDDALLGRYLAGEVNPEERRNIENALDELPELRKLTDLVRDVLGEFDGSAETLAFAPQPVPYGPATLPFPQHPARQATTAAGAGQPSRPARPWRTRTPAARNRRRAELVAAAVLLLALGVALPQAGMVSPPAEHTVAMSQPVAFRGEEPFRLALGGVRADLDDKLIARSGDFKELAQRVERVDMLGARIQAEVETLEKVGKKREAETLARQYASNLTRIALFDQQRGELARAEQAYNEACLVCARTLGDDAPETIRTRNSLADVYEVALNTADPSVYSQGDANAANPYFTSSDFPALPQGVAAKNVGHAEARVDPATNYFHGRTRAYRMKDPPPASPSTRGLSPAVRSSSGYEPPVPAAPQQRVAPTPEPRVYAMHAPAPPAQALQQAALVLHDRIISQRQTELKTSVVPVLTQALREAKSATERQRFAVALGRLGPASRDSVDGLLDCYHRATAPSERATILLSLGEIGPTAQKALPVLVDSLQSDAPEVRNCAARAIVRFGHDALPAVRKLVLDRPDDRLLQDVLVRIDGPEGRCGIDDESGCFSVKAIQQTRQEIYHLASAFRLEIRVETSPDPVQVVAKKTKDRQQLQEIWLYEKNHAPTPSALTDEGKKRTRELGQYGVYVHINKGAPDVQVYVSDALQAQGLTDQQLRQVVEPHLRQKQFDRGLREGVRFLARFEREHTTVK
jgi:hypothetical protein